jgi:hypothetical protein
MKIGQAMYSKKGGETASEDKPNSDAKEAEFEEKNETKK